MCVMPWMVPARVATLLRPLPIPVSAILWIIAAVTMVFGWLARHDARRGWGVLTVSLLIVAGLFFTLR